MSFLSELKREVDLLARTYSVTGDRAFVVWFGRVGLELDDDEAFDALAVEGPNDKGMDLFWVDHANESVLIAQCKYSAKGANRPREKDLNTLLTCTDWLASPQTLEGEGRAELVAAAREYVEAIERDYSILLWFVYCGERSENIDKRIRVFNSNEENVQRRRMARHCDLRLLESIYEESRGAGRRIGSATITLSTDALEFEGNYGKALVASVAGEELASLYEKHGDELFARNVRSWLGARKGSVNAGIIDTVENEKERGNFWAYNNGITIVCDSFEHDPSSRRLHLTDLSVVNGCQTTVALASTRESAALGEVSLLARVICPPESIIDSVIRFTNSQNQIRRWDLVSQDRTQRRLQRDFEGLNEPVYYLLRRGDWQSLTAAEKRKFRQAERGPWRTIKHDLLAQYLASFKGNAVVAYKNKGFLFDRFYEETYPADLRVEEALFVWRAGERTQELVREEIRKETRRVQEGESERQKYVLMLKRGGRFYALGVFGLVARLRNGADYLRSITEERITSNAASGRIEKYAKVSIQWYKQVVNDLLQITEGELSVLIRREDFFERVAERVDNMYETWSVDEGWLDSTLPRLG
jgi:hypothetical protein